MTIRELYDEVGGDYNAVSVRMIKDDRIVKFVKMFINDPSYSSLVTAMEKEDIDGAFSSAHTLKGVTANLSFDSLNTVTVKMTEALRRRDITLAKALMPELMEVYQNTINPIRDLQ